MPLEKVRFSFPYFNFQDLHLRRQLVKSRYVKTKLQISKCRIPLNYTVVLVTEILFLWYLNLLLSPEVIRGLTFFHGNMLVIDFIKLTVKQGNYYLHH